MKCYKLAKGKNKKAITVYNVQQSIQYFQRPSCSLQTTMDTLIIAVTLIMYFIH